MRRVLLAIGVAAALLILVAAPSHGATAAAAPTLDTCQGEPPTPENPLAGGPLSAAMPKPEGIPKQGDPWNPADKTTILEQYGAAGMVWHTYDTGCGVGTEFMPNMWTGFSNFLTLGPRFFVALTASVANWVLSPQSWLPGLDAPVDAVSAGFVASFASPLMPLALAAAAIGIVWAAHRARFSATMTAVLFIVIGVCLLGVAANAPSKLAGQLDGVVAGTVTEVMGAGGMSDADKQNLGAKVMDPMWQAAIYDRWLEGNFGSSTSKTATTYGPQLFKAQTLTWAEAVKVEGDAAATTALYDGKKAEWKKIAQKVKDDDPSAYQYLAGTKGEDRAGVAVIAGVVAAATLPFTAVALGMTAGGYITLRFLAALLPVFAVLIVCFRSLGRTLAQIVGAVLVNTVVFAAGAAAVISISGRVFASTLNPLLEILIVFLMSFICWMILRPFRTLTRLVSNPGRGMASALEAPQDAVNAVKKFAGRAAASYTGNELADNDDAPKGDPAAAEKAAHAGRPELRENGETRTVPVAEPAPRTEPVPQAPAVAGHGTTATVTGDRGTTVVTGPWQAPADGSQSGAGPDRGEPPAHTVNGYHTPVGAPETATPVDTPETRRATAPVVDDDPAPAEPVGEQRIYDPATKQVRLVKFDQDGEVAS